MAQAHTVKGQEQVEDWDGAEEGAWEGWEEVVLGQAPAEIAFAPVVGRESLIRWPLPATI
jgi:hypothetical protein